MNSWNGLDFLFFLVFAANTILGMSRGATKEIISMMCLCVALIFTIKFTVPLANFCNNSPLISGVVDNNFIQTFMSQVGAGPLTTDLLHQLFYSISMLICFVSIYSICEGALTATNMIEAYPFPYAVANRKVGGALGFTRGYVINLIIICIFTLHIFKNSNESAFSNSFFINLFQNSAIKLDSIISGQQPEQYKQIFEDKKLYDQSELLKNMSIDNSPPSNNTATPNNTNSIYNPSP